MEPAKERVAGPAVPPAILQVVAVLVAGWVMATAIATLQVPLVLGAFLGGGFFLLFLTRPGWTMLAVLLVRASSDLTRLLPGVSAGGGLGSLANIALMMTLTIAGGIYVLSRGLPAISLPGGRLLTLLLLTGLIGVVRAGDLLDSMNEWAPVLASFVTYALAANLFITPKQLQRAVDVILASFALPAALGLYQLAVGAGIRRPEFTAPGVVGTFVHPNGFGFYLVLISALLLGQLLFHTGKRRAVATIGLCIALVLLVGTYARVAWAGILVVFLMVALLRARLLLLILPVGLVGALWYVPSIGARLADPMAAGGSLEDRLGSLWPTTIGAWLTATDSGGATLVTLVNRFAGLGPGIGPGLARYGLAAIPHNDYLRVLVEYGIFGLILHFALTGLLAVVAFRAWIRFKDSREREAAALAIAFLTLTVAYPVMSITDNLFAHTANQVYFWSLAGLMVAASRWGTRRHSEDAAIGPRQHDRRLMRDAKIE